MGKSSNTVVQNDTSSKTKLPKWVNEAGQDLYSQAKGLYDEAFTPYYGEGVVGPNQDQQQSFQMLRDWAGLGPDGSSGTGPGLLADAVGSSQNYAMAGPQGTDFYALMGDAIKDEQGNPLVGSVQDYMNPYQEAVTNQQLRGNEEDYMKAMMDNRRRAQQSGGFGDARHGVSDSLSRSSSAQAGSDIREKGALNSYNQALGMRAGELQRLGQHQKDQNQYGLDALNRAREGMGEAYDRGYDGTMANIGALMEAGQLQQANDQSAENFEYQEFLRGEADPFERLSALGAALGMAPYETGTRSSGTSTTSRPDNSGMQMAGSLLTAGMKFL